MRSSRGHQNTQRCATCGAENYPYASFCIACGEPIEPGDAFDSTWDRVEAPTSGPATRTNEGQLLTLSGLGRREAFIGIALLVIAVGFALYQWHRSDEQAAAYKEGLAAEQSKDWDKAANAFTRAGDRLGAANRAQNARTAAAERDRLYLDGIEAQDRKDWNGAAQAFEGVIEIQPSYEDSQQRLAQAESQASLVEMGGLVIRVSSSPGEGLFYLDGLGHIIQLPGSDRYSIVRATSRPGNLIAYDRPKSYAFARAMGGVIHQDQGPGSREVALATVVIGNVKDCSLPGLDPSGRGVFSPSGLWWTLPDDGPDRTWYFDLGTAQGAPVEITSAGSDRAVLAYDPPRSRVVWGQPAKQSASGPEQTILTITDPEGRMPWLVGTFDGSVESASISRDGRWLLLVTAREGQGGSREQAVYAQSLEVSWDPRYGEVMHKRIELGTMSADIGGSHISATFLPSDATPARVAIDRMEDGLENITIHSLGNNEAGQVWYYNPATPGTGDRAGFSNSADMLASPRRYGQQTILELYDLARSTFRQEFDVPLPLHSDQPVQLQFSPLKNNVVVTIQRPRDMGGRPGQDVYSVPIGSNGSPGTPKLIAHTLLNGYPTVAPAPGGSLLAYIDEKQVLRVTGYNGVGDNPIANGVTALWSLGTDTDLSWAR